MNGMIEVVNGTSGAIVKDLDASENIVALKSEFEQFNGRDIGYHLALIGNDAPMSATVNSDGVVSDIVLRGTTASRDGIAMAMAKLNLSLLHGWNGQTMTKKQITAFTQTADRILSTWGIARHYYKKDGQTPKESKLIIKAHVGDEEIEKEDGTKVTVARVDFNFEPYGDFVWAVKGHGKGKDLANFNKSLAEAIVEDEE